VVVHQQDRDAALRIKTLITEYGHGNSTFNR
jgi:hypothetical protein